MGFFKSLSKSKKLRKISKILATPVTDFQSLMSDESDRALEELMDLCESDPNVRAVMERHGASRDILSQIYNLLCAAGAGQWIKGHYVAASALCYAGPLDYLLREWIDLIKQGADSFDTTPVYRIIQYFENGEVGQIYYRSHDKDSTERKGQSTQHKEALRLQALEVNELLSRYVSVHDSSIKEAGTVSSLFRGVDFKGLYEDAVGLNSLCLKKLTQLKSLETEAYHQMDKGEQAYFECLILFTRRLSETVALLEKRQELLYLKTQGGDYSYQGHKALNEQYDNSIQQYLVVGQRLNELKHLVFD